MKISYTMKKILLILGVLTSLLAAHVVMGQATEGLIHFEVRVNMHRGIPPGDEAMKNVLPEFNMFKDQLAFNQEESLYKPAEEDEDEEFSDEASGVKMNFKRPQIEFYFHQPTSRRILLQDFLGKKYRIEDSVRIVPWKLVSDTKTILGYTCNKATYYNEERQQNVVAWYTDKLRPFLGPEGFNTLPGAVLQIDINDGERMVTAKKIENRKLEKGELKVPTGGIKTTEPEFKKIRDEHIKKMGGGNGRVIIRN
jgi:GLPGLI family protein